MSAAGSVLTNNNNNNNKNNNNNNNDNNNNNNDNNNNNNNVFSKPYFKILLDFVNSCKRQQVMQNQAICVNLLLLKSAYFFQIFVR